MFFTRILERFTRRIAYRHLRYVQRHLAQHAAQCRREIGGLTSLREDAGLAMAAEELDVADLWLRVYIQEGPVLENW